MGGLSQIIKYLKAEHCSIYATLGRTEQIVLILQWMIFKKIAAKSGQFLYREKEFKVEVFGSFFIKRKKWTILYVYNGVCRRARQNSETAKLDRLIPLKINMLKIQHFIILRNRTLKQAEPKKCGHLCRSQTIVENFKRFLVVLQFYVLVIILYSNDWQSMHTKLYCELMTSYNYK